MVEPRASGAVDKAAAQRRGWWAAGGRQARSRNVAISGAISGRFSSSAKWPVSNRCSSAVGTSRR
jgi:hypothetical protein